MLLTCFLLSKIPPKASNHGLGSSLENDRLSARHLCPRCPAGKPVGARGSGKTNSNNNVVFCCPARKTTIVKTVTRTSWRNPKKTITVKRTRTATHTFTTVLPKHIWAGKMFADYNKNGIQDPGEPPLSLIPISLYEGGVVKKRAQQTLGKLLAKNITAADGSFVLVFYTAPEQEVFVVGDAKPDVILYNATANATNSTGSGTTITVPVDNYENYLYTTSSITVGKTGSQSAGPKMTTAATKATSASGGAAATTVKGTTTKAGGFSTTAAGGVTTTSVTTTRTETPTTETPTSSKTKTQTMTSHTPSAPSAPVAGTFNVIRWTSQWTDSSDLGYPIANFFLRCVNESSLCSDPPVSESALVQPGVQNATVPGLAMGYNYTCFTVANNSVGESCSPGTDVSVAAGIPFKVYHPNGTAWTKDSGGDQYFGLGRPDPVTIVPFQSGSTARSDENFFVLSLDTGGYLDMGGWLIHIDPTSNYWVFQL